MALYRAFGLTLDSPAVFPGLHPVPADETPDVVVSLVGRAGLDAAWAETGSTVLWETRFPDGRDVRVVRAADGSQQIEYGTDALFQLSPDTGTVQCAPAVAEDAHWMRFFLDTVLWWLCLSRGRHGLHASAVESDGCVLAFAGVTGGGKTTLAAELLGRGWSLFTDDVVILERGPGDRAVSHPGPGLMNLPWAIGNPDRLGRRIARFDEQREDWIAVDRSSTAARELTALVLLRRAPGLATSLEQRDGSAIDVLPHLWGLPGDLQSHFHAAGDLVAETPIFALDADVDTEPAVMADLVERTAPAIAHRILEGSLTG